jgi:hypothetical protein
MQRFSLLSGMVFTGVVLFLAGCTGGVQIEATVGQEFVLAIGQTAEINGENLTIKFLEVVEDSRCAKNVYCIWAGRVSCVVEIEDEGSPYKMVLTQPGLTDSYSTETYQEYKFSFYVRPYPEAGKEVAQDEYRLSLIVDKVIGVLEGQVIIGPLQPVETPGETPVVPPTVYAARKIMVYDQDHTMLVRQVDLSETGYYRVELKAGIYVIDINYAGIDRSSDVPKQIEIKPSQTIRLDVDIDTGIR